MKKYYMITRKWYLRKLKKTEKELIVRIENWIIKFNK